MLWEKDGNGSPSSCLPCSQQGLHFSLPQISDVKLVASKSAAFCPGDSQLLRYCQLSILFLLLERFTLSPLKAIWGMGKERSRPRIRRCGLESWFCYTPAARLGQVSRYSHSEFPPHLTKRKSSSLSRQQDMILNVKLSVTQQALNKCHSLLEYTSSPAELFATNY